MNQQSRDTRPSNFRELAAKIYADIGYTDLRRGFRPPSSQIQILKKFSQSTTVQGQKFKAFLRDDDNDKMTTFIQQLLTTHVFHSANENQTLAINPISQMNTRQFMHDYIVPLRNELHLAPWEDLEPEPSDTESRLAVARVLLEDQQKGYSPSPVTAVTATLYHNPREGQNTQITRSFDGPE